MRGDGNMDLLEFINKDLPTIQGWCSADKALKFIEIINDIKPDLCLEIGVFGGSSLIPQAIALKENGKGLVYGIDPWCNHSAIEEMENQANKEWWGGLDLNQVYLHCKYNIERFGVEDYCKLLKNKSIDVSKSDNIKIKLKNISLDLIKLKRDSSISLYELSITDLSH